MQNRKFFNLTRQECLEVYPLVTRNAERHFKSAGLLANDGDYGNGVAHLILGVEELVKALVLLLDGKGFDLRSNKDIKPIFYQHKARHVILRDFFSIWMVVSNILPSKFKGNRSSDLFAFKSFVKLAFGALEGYMHHNWWKNADTLKQNGFYVDYSNGIIDPLAFDQTKYSHAFRNIAKFRKEAHTFIDYFNRLKDTEIIEFKERIETSELENLITERTNPKKPLTCLATHR